MYKAFKLIRKLLVTLFLLTATIIVAIGIYLYHYSDQIIQHFITEANKPLQHPIQIKAIQLNTLTAFPQITLVLHEVTIPHPIEATTKLLTAHKVYCSFDAWKLLRGQYVLDQLHLEHGQVYLLANQPYQFKRHETIKEKKPASKPLAISLSQVTLKDLAIVYNDQPNHKRYAIQAEQIQASLQPTHQTLQADLQGKATIQSIQLKDLRCTKPIPLILKASLSYDQQGQVLTLHDTRLQQATATLVLQGRCNSRESGSIDLTAKGYQIALQNLRSHLPEQFYQSLQPYQPQGKLAFNMHISKQSGKHKAASIHADFALHQGSLAVKQLASPINLQQVTGKLHIPNIKDLKTATIQTEEFTSTLANSKLIGKLSLTNFHDYYLEYCARASLDVASWVQRLPNQAITNASGQLIGDGKFATSLRQLISPEPPEQVIKLSGVFKTQGVQCKLQQIPCSLQDQTSSLMLRDNTLIMKNLAGTLGTGNFVLNGTLKNFFPCLLADQQKLCLDAKLYADCLALDELLPPKQPQTNQAASKTTIAPYWVANLACDIQELRCKRFHGKKVQGKLTIKDQKLIANNLQLSVSGGKVLLNGSLDTSTDSLHVHTLAKLQGVQLDSLFYTFENFHQSFLEDKHLGGTVFADLDLRMQADKQGRMDWEAFRAHIALQLNNGVLRNFEPMKQLAKYIAEENLANLCFASLKNNIQVKNRTIYIPPMEVHSNITHIQIAGTHTFDGKVAYNFLIPLANFKQKQNASALEEAATDALAGLNLHLKLQGHANNYKTTYDAEALKTELQDKLREQGQAFKTILQGKYKVKKVIKELTPDDYFEFD